MCANIEKLGVAWLVRLGVLSLGVNWVLSEQWLGENLEGFHLSPNMLMASL